MGVVRKEPVITHILINLFIFVMLGLALWVGTRGAEPREDREARLHAEEAERTRAIVREELSKLTNPTTKG